MFPRSTLAGTPAQSELLTEDACSFKIISELKSLKVQSRANKENVLRFA